MLKSKSLFSLASKCVKQQYFYNTITHQRRHVKRLPYIPNNQPKFSPINLQLPPPKFSPSSIRANHWGIHHIIEEFEHQRMHQHPEMVHLANRFHVWNFIQKHDRRLAEDLLHIDEENTFTSTMIGLRICDLYEALKQAPFQLDEKRQVLLIERKVMG